MDAPHEGRRFAFERCDRRRPMAPLSRVCRLGLRRQLYHSASRRAYPSFSYTAIQPTPALDRDAGPEEFVGF